MEMLESPLSINRASPLLNVIQGVAETNPNFLSLEFVADDSGG